MKVQTLDGLVDLPDELVPHGMRQNDLIDCTSAALRGYVLLAQFVRSEQHPSNMNYIEALQGAQAVGDGRAFSQAQRFYIRELLRKPG